MKDLGQNIRRPHLLQCERLVLRWFGSVGIKQGTEWLRDPLNSSRRMINWCYMMISLDILSISNPVTPSLYHNAMELFFFSAALWSLYQLLHNAPHLAVGPKAMGDGVTTCNNHLTTTNWKRGIHEGALCFLVRKNHIMSHTIAAKWANGAIVRNDGLLANNLGLCQMSGPLRNLQQPRKMTHSLPQFSKPKMCWELNPQRGKLGVWPHYLRW